GQNSTERVAGNGLLLSKRIGPFDRETCVVRQPREFAPAHAGSIQASVDRGGKRPSCVVPQIGGEVGNSPLTQSGPRLVAIVRSAPSPIRQRAITADESNASQETARAFFRRGTIASWRRR